MTTRISATAPYPDVIIENIADHTNVWVTLSGGGLELSTSVERAEFLAAIATELDVIIIPRSDLPEVTKTNAHDQPDRDHYVRHRDTGQVKIMRRKSAEKHRRWATEHLALAEHLEKRPPIDEAQVDALTDLIVEADGTESVTQKLAIRHVARRLVAAGVRAPQAGDDQ